MQGIGLLESVLRGDVVFDDYDLYTHRSINCLQTSDTVVYGQGSVRTGYMKLRYLKRFGIFPILGVDKNDLSDWCGVEKMSPLGHFGSAEKSF